MTLKYFPVNIQKGDVVFYSIEILAYYEYHQIKECFYITLTDHP